MMRRGVIGIVESVNRLGLRSDLGLLNCLEVAGRDDQRFNNPTIQQFNTSTIQQSLILLVLSLLPLFSVAQTVTFEAEANVKQVVKNSYFDLSFTLKNADGSSFRPPSFNNFVVASGPSRAVSTTIINGQMTKEMSYKYVLQPRQVGRFQIGSASIKVNGKVLQTSPITIEVVEGRTSVEGTEHAEVFIRAEPSVTEAWIGQQVILDYKLYTTINIERYNVVDESTYPGFFARDIKRYNSRQIKEVINGVEYVTKVLRRVALFPQQTGTLTIEPMTLQLGISDGNGPASSFFLRRIPVRTEPADITVRSLPSGAPESFTGAVGKYTFETQINRNTITTDDALSIKITIAGNGDVKRVQAPELELPEKFELYDPKVLEESTYERSGELTGKKTVEYLMVPKEKGRYEIQPTFSYFDTDSAKYVALEAPLYEINVRQGTQKQDRPVIAETEEAVVEDIRYIKMNEKLYPKNKGFFGSIGYWVLSILPLLLLGGALLLKRIQDQRSNIDPLLLKSRRARKVALKRLATAEKHLQEQNSRAFYDEISKAMLGYVCDKLKIPVSELTKDNVKEKLQSLEVKTERIERFLQIIKTTEMALFAGMDNSAAMNQTYQDTLDLLAGIEENLKNSLD